MRGEQRKATWVLAGTLLFLAALGVGRYLGVGELPQVRALQRQAAQRVLYYRVDGGHAPSFLLSGAERAVRLVSHQLLAKPGPQARFDTAKTYSYAMRLRLVDPAGRELWQTTLRETSRQSKEVAKSGAWAWESVYVEGRGQEVTDARSSTIALPLSPPPGTRLVISPADPQGEPMLLRAYALTRSPREDLRARLSQSPSAPLRGLSYRSAQELGLSSRGGTETGAPERMIAQDDSQGRAEVLALFVRRARNNRARRELPSLRWLGGPWERALMVKGPGSLAVELAVDLAQEQSDDSGSARPGLQESCPEGALLVEQWDMENKHQLRRYDLALRRASRQEPRRCISGRLEVQLGAELRDLRLRWSPTWGERMQLRLWAQGQPLAILTREGWKKVEPGSEILDRASLRIETEVVGRDPKKPLRYMVQAGASQTRELEISARRWLERAHEPTLYPGQYPEGGKGLENAELTWAFLDEKGQRVGSGRLELLAPFDPTSWALVPGQSASVRAGVDPADPKSAPMQVSLPDRIRVKVPKHAHQLEVLSSAPTLLKVSARLSYDKQPAPLMPTFAQINIGLMKWISAPRQARHWLGLRAQELALQDVIDVESQLHLALRPVPEKKAPARWATLEPAGRSTRQEVLLAMDRPAASCANCWFELSSGEAYSMTSKASLRRPTKILIDMGKPQPASALQGCRLELDGEPTDLRCPILRATHSIADLSPGSHRLKWSGAPKGARLWVNQPARGQARGNEVPTYKRRMLHELSPLEALGFTWKKSSSQASRLHIDVYVPQSQASSSIMQAEFRVGLVSSSASSLAEPKRLTGRRIKQSQELRFLQASHAGEFSVYRFVVDVAAEKTAGRYQLEFKPRSQGKVWIRAANRI